jgi:hypothetical protein
MKTTSIIEAASDDMPAEIDFSKAARGRHHVPDGAAVFLPTSIRTERLGVLLGSGETPGCWDVAVAD